ncbi:MAG: hypothetical protein U9N57_09920 [Pseudomonadota bacterium]|nr:hypothetical protein [Pseudomonadota bacterium]
MLKTREKAVLSMILPIVQYFLLAVGSLIIGAAIFWSLAALNLSIFEFVFIIIFPLIFMVIIPMVAAVLFMKSGKNGRR